MEWLYHIGCAEDQIEELAEHSANTIPVMMPYIDAFFMPRAMGDRPDIVPKGAVNFAFMVSLPRRSATPSSPPNTHAHRYGKLCTPCWTSTAVCRGLGST